MYTQKWLYLLFAFDKKIQKEFFDKRKMVLNRVTKLIIERYNLFNFGKRSIFIKVDNEIGSL